MPYHILHREYIYPQYGSGRQSREKWRRAEWRKSDGKDIQNKELWQLFLEESKEHEIEIVYENNSEYKRTLEAYLQGEEV